MSSIHLTFDGGVARVEIDRPPVNVIDLPVAAELEGAIGSAAARDDVAVIVLSGRGRAFCAGVEVRDHLPDRGAAMLQAFHRACLALVHAPQPTIAVVQGAALGGGCELTLACDLVVAAERATFGQPEIRLGVFPPFAAVALPRMIASHRATEMLLTGRILTATEAERWGLVNRMVPDAELGAAAEETVRALLALSPSSLRLTRELLRRVHARPSAVDVDVAERFYVEHLLETPDAIEGLQAFLEKRAPRWTGATQGTTGSS